jgi:hypothetical protein
MLRPYCGLRHTGQELEPRDSFAIFAQRCDYGFECFRLRRTHALFLRF